MGMVLHHGRLVEGEARISLHGWASGVYTLLYRSPKGSQQVRFVKERASEKFTFSCVKIFCHEQIFLTKYHYFCKL